MDNKKTGKKIFFEESPKKEQSPSSKEHSPSSKTTVPTTSTNKNVGKKPEFTGGVRRIYGLKRSPENKKQKFQMHNFQTPRSILPTVFDLRTTKNYPKCDDQGDIGSCAAHASTFLFWFDEFKQNESKVFKPSRKFQYYIVRDKEGTPNEDSGSTIADNCEVLQELGSCDESLCQYDTASYCQKPSQECYQNASQHKAKQYKLVAQNLSQIKSALVSGFPIAFGMQVPENFENETTAKTGVMSMPTKHEEFLGGHAMSIVGYDDHKNSFIVRNSWGTTWGDNGHVYIPYKFVMDKEYCDEFWMITSIAQF